MEHRLTGHGDAQLCELEARELARLIAAAEISPVEAVEASLAQIEAAEPALNACTVVLESEARALAREAERTVLAGAPLGRLHGVPVAVKDAIWMREQPATMGSRALADFRPTEDAASVVRLRAAGAVILAKTTNPELLWSAYTTSELSGVTRNPWDLRLTPGGSSGGSGAAVAARMVPLALGTDAGGSVRIPASFCGIVGIKPSHGIVARGPAFEEMRSLNVVGPLARSVGDARHCLEVISGPDPADNLSVPDALAYEPREDPVHGCRIAWSETIGDHPVDPVVRETFREVVASLRRAGWNVERATPEVWDLGQISMPILLTEHAPLIAGREHLLSPLMQDLVRRGERLSAHEYHDAQLARAAYTRRFEAFFDDYDALLTPTTAMRPFVAVPDGPVDIDGTPVDIDLDTEPFNLTTIANLTGAPAISLPAGLGRDGLPVGVQLLCRRFADRFCTDLAERMSAVLPAPPRWAPSSSRRW